jgi:hypothetical protein
MAAKETKTYFLGRGGRAHGPFTQEQYEKLRLSGDIDHYTYQWDDSAKDWVNLDPKPPTPGAAPGTRRRNSSSLENTEAVCHDRHEVVIGVLENVSDLGCELVSDEHCPGPKLGVNSPLVLNVTSASGEKAMNVRASLSSVERRDKAWVYRLRWAEIPSF